MTRLMKRIARFLLALPLFLAGVGAILSGVEAAMYNASAASKLLGNRPEAVEALKGNGENMPFSFAVVGDTRGTETSERLLEAVASEKEVRFIVHVGDFVKNPDIWNHNFFRAEYGEDMPRQVPMFLVAGNHDLCRTGEHRSVSRERLVGPERFDELYGTRKFCFSYANSFFIISDIDDAGNEYLDFLEGALRDNRDKHEHVFVFLHIPPRNLSHEIDSRELPQQDRLLALLKQYRVTRAFFGDFHGYWRGQMEETTVLITGGGGSELAGDETYGFYHLLVVTVDGAMITERIITRPPTLDVEDHLEEFCYVRVFPLFGTSPWFYRVAGAALIAGGIMLLFFTRRRKRGAPSAVAP